MFSIHSATPPSHRGAALAPALQPADILGLRALALQLRALALAAVDRVEAAGLVGVVAASELVCVARDVVDRAQRAGAGESVGQLARRHVEVVNCPQPRSGVSPYTFALSTSKLSCVRH